MKSLVLFSLSYAVILSQPALAAKRIEVSSQERASILERAQVWSDEDGPIAAKNLLQGPSNKYEFNEHIECKFYDSFYKEVSDTGKTEKFWCVPSGGSPDKDDIKVKYNQENGEVFAEVAASRLLWALGFFRTEHFPSASVVKIVLRILGDI